MLVPAQGHVMARTRHTIARLRGVFPDLDRVAFTSMMANIRRGFRRIAKHKMKTPLFNSEEALSSIIREAVPVDDSSLQWSPLGAGLTDNPQATLIISTNVSCLGTTRAPNTAEPTMKYAGRF